MTLRFFSAPIIVWWAMYLCFYRLRIRLAFFLLSAFFSLSFSACSERIFSCRAAISLSIAISRMFFRGSVIPTCCSNALSLFWQSALGSLFFRRSPAFQKWFSLQDWSFPSCFAYCRLPSFRICSYSSSHPSKLFNITSDSILLAFRVSSARSWLLILR